MMETTDLTLYGVRVQESEHIDRNVVIHMRPENVVLMHPLMRIELTHRGDPIGRSEAVARYFTERTKQELAAVLARVNARLAIARTFDVPLGMLPRDGDDGTTSTMSGLVANDHVIEAYWGGAR